MRAILSGFERVFPKTGYVSIQNLRVFCKALKLTYLAKSTRLLGNGLESLTGLQGKNFRKMGWVRMLRFHYRILFIK